MPGPRAAQDLQMPHPRDWQGGQMPRSSPGGGGGAGRSWNWLMHKFKLMFQAGFPVFAVVLKDELEARKLLKVFFLQPK